MHPAPAQFVPGTVTTVFCVQALQAHLVAAWCDRVLEGQAECLKRGRRVGWLGQYHPARERIAQGKSW